MKQVDKNIHRILAPRLVVLLGTTSEDGQKNIIPINNITSVSVDPCMVAIALYKPWATTSNLKSTKGFTISVPKRNQLEVVWKLGQKFSGYSSNQNKIDEFREVLDLDFSDYGPVIKDALGCIEFEIADITKDVGGDHVVVIGRYAKATIDPESYDDDISPIGNPKPFMQWASNKFVEASDIFDIDYYEGAKS